MYVISPAHFQHDVFPKKKTINYSHVTHFIRFYWCYYIKVVEIGYAASSAKIKPNRFKDNFCFSDFMQIRLKPCLINMLESVNFTIYIV